MIYSAEKGLRKYTTIHKLSKCCDLPIFFFDKFLTQLVCSHPAIHWGTPILDWNWKTNISGKCIVNLYYGMMHRSTKNKMKLEDLKVLRLSPDLLNNVKIGQGQLQLIMKHFVLPKMGVAAILVK